MIHFFLTFSKDAADSPFGRRLVEMGVQNKIIAGEVRHRFRHRLWMVFIGRPQTAWFAICAAVRSIVLESPEPRVVVVWTHIEALIVSLVRWLFRRPSVRIVLVGFILTRREGGLQNALRSFYFRRVFSVVDMAVVHSRVEAARYAALYNGRKTRFVFIPWGSHIDGLDALMQASSSDDTADVLCAGRSGRDYVTLYRALAGTPCRVKIVCDLAESMNGCEPADNIQVLDKCYGAAYFHELAGARCVVIPLGVADISAGQMVLLQAMQMGKAVVMTRTTTTVDYATDGYDALLVDAADAHALRAAVERVLADARLRAALGANAKESFAEKFTVPGMVTSLVNEIRVMDPKAGVHQV